MIVYHGTSMGFNEWIFIMLIIDGNMFWLDSFDTSYII